MLLLRVVRQTAERTQSFPFFTPPAPGKDGLGVRRGRKAFTRHQLLELEKEFHLSHHLARPRRLEGAAGLKLSKIRFQNRRMRHRKEHKDAKVVARRAPRRQPLLEVVRV